MPEGAIKGLIDDCFVPALLDRFLKERMAASRTTPPQQPAFAGVVARNQMGDHIVRNIGDANSALFPKVTITSGLRTPLAGRLLRSMVNTSSRKSKAREEA
jgi:hypothetical protein